MVMLQVDSISTPLKDVKAKGRTITNLKTTGGKISNKAEIQEGSDVLSESPNVGEFE